jgi:ascorbate-specific PTS system EIIC-type component UlaA
MAGGDTGILELPYECSAAITKLRYVKVTGDQTVGPATAQGELVLGVSKVDVSATEATQGKGCTVQVLGVAWVEASAAIVRFVEVTTAADGRAITAATTNRVAGIALKAAANAGDWIPVLLNGGAGRILP